MPSLTITKPKIVFKNGKPSEVILKWKDFQKLIEEAEDRYDLAEIKKILKSGKARFKAFDEMLLDKHAL